MEAAIAQHQQFIYMPIKGEEKASLERAVEAAHWVGVVLRSIQPSEL
jgi:hypothetical protein